jgi:hypothetical protein
MTERVERLTSVIKNSLPHDNDLQAEISESESGDKLSQIEPEGYDRV